MAPRMTSVYVACDNCGKQVKRTPSQIKKGKRHFCKVKCRAEFLSKESADLRPVVSCANCGAPIKRHHYRIANHEFHYCGQECRYTHQATLRHGKDNPNHSQRIEVPCDHCGKILARTPYQLSIRKYNFCNYDCKNKWQVDQVAVSCTQCGTPFEMDRGIAERTPNHFCCKEHQAQWMSATFVGENHHQWQGGAAGYYGKNWKEQRRKARKRDGYKCQHCGLTEKKLGGELDVHHITPFREFGIERYKEANHLSNLITLCRPCHRMAEYGKIPVQPKLL